MNKIIRIHAVHFDLCGVEEAKFGVVCVVCAEAVYVCPVVCVNYHTLSVTA